VRIAILTVDLAESNNDVMPPAHCIADPSPT